MNIGVNISYGLHRPVDHSPVGTFTFLPLHLIFLSQFHLCRPKKIVFFASQPRRANVVFGTRTWGARKRGYRDPEGLQERGCRSRVTRRGYRKRVTGAGLREGVAGAGLQEQGCRKGLQEQGCRGHPRAPAPLKFWCRKQRSLDVNHSVSTVVRRKILFFSDDINETAIKR